jgi:hypothetical protein
LQPAARGGTRPSRRLLSLARRRPLPGPDLPRRMQALRPPAQRVRSWCQPAARGGNAGSQRQAGYHRPQQTTAQNQKIMSHRILRLPGGLHKHCSATCPLNRGPFVPGWQETPSHPATCRAAAPVTVAQLGTVSSVDEQKPFTINRMWFRRFWRVVPRRGCSPMIWLGQYTPAGWYCGCGTGCPCCPSKPGAPALPAD